jgi:hypothetical protein
MNANQYKKVIIDRLAPLLVSLGFERDGDTLVRREGNVLHLVNIQKGRESTKAFFVFTINLGVFSVPLGAKLGITGSPDIWDCHWRQRLGFLLPEKDDIWWKVDSLEVASQTGEYISELIAKHAIPFFQRIDSTNTLISLWKQDISAGLTKGQIQKYLALFA